MGLLARRSITAVNPDNSRELTASAASITDPNGYMKSRAKNNWGRNRLANTWKWYSKIGEIRYAVARAGRIAGHARLNVVMLDENGEPGELDRDAMSLKVAGTLRSTSGGQRQLVSRFYMLSKIQGVMHLLRVTDANGEPIAYDMLSTKQIEYREEKIYRVHSPAEGTMPQVDSEITKGNMLGDIWTPSPEWDELPESPLTALDDICNQLYLLTLGTTAKLRSRLATAGLLLLPTSLSTVASAVAMTSGGPTYSTDPALNSLIRAFVVAIADPEAPAGASPILMKINPDDAKVVQHIDIAREVFATDMALREELIGRILAGLDVVPSNTGGKGTEIKSHWGVWADDADNLRSNVEPELEVLSWALTQLVLWPELRRMGMPEMEISKRIVWYDPSKIQSKVNKVEDARQANDRGIVGPGTVRSASGFNEIDAMSDEEYVRWVGVKTGNAWLMAYGLDTLSDEDWEMAAKFAGKKDGPSPVEQGDPAKAGPGVGDPGSPNPSDRDGDGKKSDEPAS